MRERRLRRGTSIWRIAFVAAVLFVAAFPVYWMLVTATTPTAELFEVPPKLAPQLDASGFSAFALAWTDTDLPRWLRNSAVISTMTTLLAVLTSVLAGYAMARYRYRGRAVVNGALLATQMLPEAMLVVPIFFMYVGLGLLNQHWALALLNAAFMVPLLTWLLYAAIAAVPLELEESARIDGCPSLGIQVGIVWPTIAPSLAAAAVIAFFGGWNEYLFARTMLVDSGLLPASVGLSRFIGELSTPLGTVMAAGLLYTIPAVIFFLVVQRRIISGVTAGSVKG